MISTQDSAPAPYQHDKSSTKIETRAPSFSFVPVPLPKIVVVSPYGVELNLTELPTCNKPLESILPQTPRPLFSDRELSKWATDNNIPRPRETLSYDENALLAQADNMHSGYKNARAKRVVAKDEKATGCRAMGAEHRDCKEACTVFDEEITKLIRSSPLQNASLVDLDPPQCRPGFVPTFPRPFSDHTRDTREPRQESLFTLDPKFNAPGEWSSIHYGRYRHWVGAEDEWLLTKIVHDLEGQTLWYCDEQLDEMLGHVPILEARPHLQDALGTVISKWFEPVINGQGVRALLAVYHEDQFNYFDEKEETLIQIGFCVDKSDVEGPTGRVKFKDPEAPFDPLGRNDSIFPWIMSHQRSKGKAAESKRVRSEPHLVAEKQFGLAQLRRCKTDPPRNIMLAAPADAENAIASDSESEDEDGAEEEYDGEHEGSEDGNERPAIDTNLGHDATSTETRDAVTTPVAVSPVAVALPEQLVSDVKTVDEPSRSNSATAMSPPEPNQEEDVDTLGPLPPSPPTSTYQGEAQTAPTTPISPPVSLDAGAAVTVPNSPHEPTEEDNTEDVGTAPSPPDEGPQPAFEGVGSDFATTAPIRVPVRRSMLADRNQPAILSRAARAPPLERIEKVRTYEDYHMRYPGIGAPNRRDKWNDVYPKRLIRRRVPLSTQHKEFLIAHKFDYQLTDDESD